MRTVLAFDLGGSRLKAGLITAGQALRVETAPTPGADEVPALLEAVGEKLLEGARPDGVGLCVPGLVEDGRIVALPGKLEGIVGVDLRSGLRTTFGRDPVVVNDAIAAGLGEALGGAGRDASRVVVITIGTGIGVAVIEDGEPLGGGMRGGGQLGGQIPIGEGGEDTSGRSGTIEALCRAQRIVDLAGEGFGSVEEVFAAARANDPAASSAIARYRIDLARSLVALAHAHAPERIVVGGGPITPGEPLLPGIEDLVRPALFAGYDVEIRPAELGDAAALVGLAHLCERRAA